MLPKTSTSVKSYDGKTKWIYCFIKDVELLETYNDIWNNVSYSIKKELDFEPIHNNEFLKTEIRLTVTRLQIFTIMKYLK